jgi:hypothetical protein
MISLLGKYLGATNCTVDFFQKRLPESKLGVVSLNQIALSFGISGCMASVRKRGKRLGAYLNLFDAASRNITSSGFVGT